MLNVYPRDADVLLVLIVERHMSCLHYELFYYIKNPKHKCYIYLGISYATSICRWGICMNKTVNLKHTGIKQKKLMTWRNFRAIGYIMSQWKILPLLNIIWKQRYNHTKISRKAIAARGWYSPRYKVLSHSKLIINMAGT